MKTMNRSKPVWNVDVDERVDEAIAEVLGDLPGGQVSIRELQDDRGVVAIVVCAGDGRLIAAARSVDLAPVAWPWPLTDGVAGLLPRRECPTVSEFVAGITRSCAEVG
jgi:hypothetical protein